MEEHSRIHLMVAMIIFCSATTVRSQSSVDDQSHKLMMQTPDARELILQKAQTAGADIAVTIDLKVPLTAGVLENVVLNGQLQSVFVVATDSDWQVTIYSTPESPITSLSHALASAQRLHREIESTSLLGVRGFTFRGSAPDVVRARDVLPNARFVEVTDLSELAKLDSVPSATEKRTVKKAQQQPSFDLATAEESFEPDNVELMIQTLPTGERKIEIIFSWNGPTDLTALMKDRATLEIQVLFFNHAKNKKDKNLTYVGRIKSVNTNFDMGRTYQYVDTDALNGAGIAGKPEEREVAVGSYNAQADFHPGKQYKVSVTTEGGLLNANLAKLSFQVGIYEPKPWDGLDASAVAAYCTKKRLAGNYDPANCVYGKRTFIVTPKNSINSTYSILAPTVPSFKYPTRPCDTPVGYPQLTEGLDKISESAAQLLATQALLFQKSFERNGGKNAMGCAANSVHTDTSWWPRRGVIQDFDGKGKSALMLAPDASQAYWVHGGIWSRYVGLGGPKALMGEPKGDEQPITSSRKTKGAYQAFDRGWLYYHQPQNRVFYVVNAIAQKYRSLGMHTDQLGLPTSDEYTFQGGARNDFEGGYIYWTSAKGTVVVRNTGNSGPVKPTLQTYSLRKTPRANEPFDGTIKGTGFVTNSTKVWFCLSGTRNCYPQPQNGVTVKNSSQLDFKNVRLSSGAWEMYVETAGGQSAHSTPFAVLVGPPTIEGYKWTTTPKANKNFSGHLTGTDLINRKTEVLFCIKGKSTCYPHPMNGISVESAKRVNVKNVRLSKGKWQVVLRTPAGQSDRSSVFTVK